MQFTQAIASVDLHHYTLLRGKLYSQVIFANILWSWGEYCQLIPVQNFVLAHFEYL